MKNLINKPNPSYGCSTETIRSIHSSGGLGYHVAAGPRAKDRCHTPRTVQGELSAVGKRERLDLGRHRSRAPKAKSERETDRRGRQHARSGFNGRGSPDATRRGSFTDIDQPLPTTRPPTLAITINAVRLLAAPSRPSGGARGPLCDEHARMQPVRHRHQRRRLLVLWLVVPDELRELRDDRHHIGVGLPGTTTTATAPWRSHV